MTASGAVGVASRTTRLIGVDVARALALLGMMSVHILPMSGPDGTVSLAYQVSSGRASALFAVLAGVGLALATGRDTPPSGSALASACRGVAARGAVVAAVGLTLGGLGTGLAIILVHYGVLFCCALPFLGLRWRALAAWALAWLLLSPVVAHLLRPMLDPGPEPQPSWELLASDPGRLVTVVLLTGYYPVVQWTGYLLVGLAVGRTGLRGRRTALAVGGVGLAGVAAGLGSSALLLGPLGGMARLEAAVPPDSLIASLGLDYALSTSMYGTTPTTSWWWLAVAAPHSSTPPDLLHTAGSALVVLAACLLVVPAARRAGLVASGAVQVLAAAGSMTLTLYTLHAVALAAVPSSTVDRAQLLLVHAVVALAVATVWRSTGWRGPLEALAAAAARAVR